MPRSGEDARRRLQRAAFELFQERGYAETTAAEIAARAGLTERTFFRHFPDKREALFSGEAEFRDTLIGALAAAPEGLAPFEAMLRGFRAVAPMLETYRPFAEARSRLTSETPALREREHAKAAALIESVAETLRRRGVAEPTATLAAQAGMAAFGYALRAWNAEGGDLDAQFARALAQLRSLAAGP